MAEEDKNHHHMYQDSWTFQYHDHTKNKNDHDQTCTSSTSTSTSSIGEESTVSNGSSSSVCCSSDTADDASSSSSSSKGSLYDLSEIMTQLPIKRGLSKFYQGKSESFTSLSRVTSVEDLVKKKATPYRRKLKASKSCGNGLISNNSYRTYTLPKATISKKPTRGCSFHPFQVKKGVS